MATFDLIARRDINLPDGVQVRRGDLYTIHINMPGINKNNLFNNSRCMGQLQQQLAYNGISLPKDSWLLKSSGPWDIRMR